MSRFETALRVVLEFNQAYNRHDVAGMMQLVNDDCVFEDHTPAPDGAMYSGKPDITMYWQEFFKKSPDAQVKIEDIFSLGARCVMRWRCVWQDQAGNEAYVRGVDLFKVENELICEQLSYVKG